MTEPLVRIRGLGKSFGPTRVLEGVDLADVAASIEHEFAVLARRQTRGKGRLGRVWHSDSPVSLYASLGFRPEVEPERMRTFTLWMGVNLCALLANFTGVEPGIKWPNDILFGDRKAGGLLTEARIDADRIRDLILGIGLNVNPPPRTASICITTPSTINLPTQAIAAGNRPAASVSSTSVMVN